MHQFIGMIEAIQLRMIELFESNQAMITSANTKFGHKMIVYNMDEIIGMLSAFSKHRTYSDKLINYLCEQIFVNIQQNNPQYAASITYLDEHTKERKMDKNIKMLFPIYTSILRHLRYLNGGNRKLFALIGSSL